MCISRSGQRVHGCCCRAARATDRSSSLFAPAPASAVAAIDRSSPPALHSHSLIQHLLPHIVSALLLLPSDRLDRLRCAASSSILFPRRNDLTAADSKQDASQHDESVRVQLETRGAGRADDRLCLRSLGRGERESLWLPPPAPVLLTNRNNFDRKKEK